MKWENMKLKGAFISYLRYSRYYSWR